MLVWVKGCLLVVYWSCIRANLLSAFLIMLLLSLSLSRTIVGLQFMTVKYRRPRRIPIRYSGKWQNVQTRSGPLDWKRALMSSVVKLELLRGPKMMKQQAKNRARREPTWQTRALPISLTKAAKFSKCSSLCLMNNFKSLSPAIPGIDHPTSTGAWSAAQIWLINSLYPFDELPYLEPEETEASHDSPSKQ